MGQGLEHLNVDAMSFIVQSSPSDIALVMKWYEETFLTRRDTYAISFAEMKNLLNKSGIHKSGCCIKLPVRPFMYSLCLHVDQDVLSSIYCILDKRGFQNISFQVSRQNIAKK